MGKINNIKSFLKKVYQFGWYIPTSNLIITYGQYFFSSVILSKIMEKRTKKIQHIIEQLVSFPKELPKSLRNKNRTDAPIWFFWLQGEDNLPEIPRLCLQSIRKYANGHKVIVLTAENYKQYVKIPDFIIEKFSLGRIKAAHFADILRINLLAQQGGLWLDATMLVTKDLPEEIFEAPFFSIKTNNLGYFVSQCRWSVFCLSSEKGNPLFVHLASLFEQYLSKTDIFVDYFLFDNFIDMMYKRYQTIRVQIDNIPFNNPYVHNMLPQLCKETSEDKFKELTKETYLFKLSYKTYTTEMLNTNPNNLYSRLNKQFK